MKNILLLSNNDNISDLYDWLTVQGYPTILFHDRIDSNIINKYSPFFVISYNYRFIVGEDVIQAMGNNIINLHTSLLPWNKGSSPNIWSFIENTPKGVTIHRLEKGLDTGHIIVQKELFFDERTETFSSSYQKLHKEMVELFKQNWNMIKSGDYPLIEQTQKGSYHRTADLTAFLNGRTIDYNMPITAFKEMFQKSE